jgi:hypothetical protein
MFSESSMNMKRFAEIRTYEAGSAKTAGYGASPNDILPSRANETRKRLRCWSRDVQAACASPDAQQNQIESKPAIEVESVESGANSLHRTALE